MTKLTGYMHPMYAESLSEFGTPRKLPRTGGWILERQIPGFPYQDAMGCYPLFACPDWAGLQADIEELSRQYVCVFLVPDPFGRYDLPCLQRCFGDVFIPFKEHCVIDLARSREAISVHHRRYARKALEVLTIEDCSDPAHFLDEFLVLHSTLVAKHKIRGMRAFSRNAFAKQLMTPGMTVMRALYNGMTVAAILWFEQREEDVVFGHVLGYSDLGYRLGAQYALYWVAIGHFADRVRWCDVGGVPGRDSHGSSGLAWFKRGWSRETRTAYLCGRIFNRGRYEEVVAARGTSGVGYFPAYRTGEMD